MTEDHLRTSANDDETIEIESAGAGNSGSPPTVTQVNQRISGSSGAPQCIGPFRIIAKIGEGGMGTVYEAEQESPKRTVALKVIRGGLASSGLLKRFELESQVLGRLQHPGIAQVYQAGTAETDQGERPYFAMEYIRGVNLRRHVKQENPRTRQRLELLGRICDAVHHAHQKGVIHRDLKPGNILVDQSGQPKILDFGVARATDSDMQVTTVQTDVGQLIGTLQYMSPEQVAADPNDLDTRSDVYALGVIAYEMLTDHVPYNLKNKMIHEVARIIRENEPTSLSATNKTFRGDIETIISKALEKDKERRYQSAAGLADDIRRYLSDEPIHARSPSAVYQLQKFAKRNKAIAGGMSIAIAALLVGMITSTYLYIQAESARAGEQEQRLLAEEREANAVAAREVSDQVVEFLTTTLGAADPEKSGKDVTVREVMDQAAVRVGEDFENKPLIEARLRDTIGWTYRGLGLLDAADRHISTAAAIRVRELGDTHPDALSSMNKMGVLLREQGKFDGAGKTHRKNYEVYRRAYGDEHPKTLNSVMNLANVLLSLGQFEEAIGLYQKTLEIQRRVLGAEHPHALLSMANLVSILTAQGRYTDAEQLCRQTIEIQDRILGTEHPNTLRSRVNLAIALHGQGRDADAESEYRAVLEIQRTVLGEKHPTTMLTMGNLGEVLYAQGHYMEAERIGRETVELHRRVLGREHPATLTFANNLANALDGQGRYKEAEQLYRQTLKIQRRTQGEEHTNTLAMMNNFANALERKGEYLEAQELYLQVLETQSRVLGDHHPHTLHSALGVAGTHVGVGNFDEAVRIYRTTIEEGRRTFGSENATIGSWLVLLGEALIAKGDASEAKQVIEEGIAIQTDLLSEDHRDLTVSQSVFGECLLALGQHSDAETLLLKSYDRLVEVQGATGHDSRKTLARLVKLYESWNAAEPGNGYDAKSTEWRAKLPEEETEDND